MKALNENCAGRQAPQNLTPADPPQPTGSAVSPLDALAILHQYSMLGASDESDRLAVYEALASAAPNEETRAAAGACAQAILRGDESRLQFERLLHSEPTANPEPATPCQVDAANGAPAEDLPSSLYRFTVETGDPHVAELVRERQKLYPDGVIDLAHVEHVIELHSLRLEERNRACLDAGSARAFLAAYDGISALPLGEAIPQLRDLRDLSAALTGLDGETSALARIIENAERIEALRRKIPRLPAGGV